MEPTATISQEVCWAHGKAWSSLPLSETVAQVISLPAHGHGRFWSPESLGCGPLPLSALHTTPSASVASRASHPLCPLPPSAPSSGWAVVPSLRTGGLAAVCQKGLAQGWISQAVTSGVSLSSQLDPVPAACLTSLDDQSLSEDLVRGQFPLFAPGRSP